CASGMLTHSKNLVCWRHDQKATTPRDRRLARADEHRQAQEGPQGKPGGGPPVDVPPVRRRRGYRDQGRHDLQERQGPGWHQADTVCWLLHEGAKGGAGVSVRMRWLAGLAVAVLCILSGLLGLTAGINLNPDSTVRFVPNWGSVGDW